MVSIFSATDSVLQTETHTHNQCMIPAAHIVLMNIQHDIRYSGRKKRIKKRRPSLMNSLSLYKWKRKDVESCAAAVSDIFYAQARRGQLVYGGGDFNMRQSN